MQLFKCGQVSTSLNLFVAVYPQLHATHARETDYS